MCYMVPLDNSQTSRKQSKLPKPPQRHNKHVTPSNFTASGLRSAMTYRHSYTADNLRVTTLVLTVRS